MLPTLEALLVQVQSRDKPAFAYSKAVGRCGLVRLDPQIEMRFHRPRTRMCRGRLGRQLRPARQVTCRSLAPSDAVRRPTAKVAVTRPAIGTSRRRRTQTSPAHYSWGDAVVNEWPRTSPSKSLSGQQTRARKLFRPGIKLASTSAGGNIPPISQCVVEPDEFRLPKRNSAGPPGAHGVHGQGLPAACPPGQDNDWLNLGKVADRIVDPGVGACRGADNVRRGLIHV